MDEEKQELRELLKRLSDSLVPSIIETAKEGNSKFQWVMGSMVAISFAQIGFIADRIHDCCWPFYLSIFAIFVHSLSITFGMTFGYKEFRKLQNITFHNRRLNTLLLLGQSRDLVLAEITEIEDLMKRENKPINFPYFELLTGSLVAGSILSIAILFVIEYCVR